DQAGQFLLVDVELGDDAAGVADQGRGRREQARELRLQYGVRVPGGVGGPAGRGQQGEREPSGGQGAPRTAVDDQAQRGGAGDDGDARADGEVGGAVAGVPGDLVLESRDALRAVDEGLGALRVELVHVDVEAQGGGVAVELQGAQRRDIDLRAAGE